MSGGQRCLGMNVRGGHFAGGTTMPTTPGSIMPCPLAAYDRVFEMPQPCCNVLLNNYMHVKHMRFHKSTTVLLPKLPPPPQVGMSD